MSRSGLRRRHFLLASGAAFAAVLSRFGQAGRARAAGAFGPLVPDPDGIFDLPAGFRYRILDQFGDPMDDGYVVPAKPDGMATFPGPDGTVILMRNHELLFGDGPYPPGEPPPEAYDPLGMGCVTRVVLDARDFARISSNLVLCGTVINCAGGPTPWGWLSCEESTAPQHGYVFLCDPHADRVQMPNKIPAYGRFKHEAACIDTRSNTVYLTEDQTDSSFYRFVPDDPREPFVGRLQALRIVGKDRYPAADMTRGQTLPIAWVDIDTPDPGTDTVSAQAQEKGAAVFARGEGITIFKHEIFIVTTSGGPIGRGQIFRLIDSPDDLTLEVVVVADETEIINRPDNITVAPWGEPFFSEDSGGTNYVRSIGPDGEIFDFGRNALSDSELSGVCFSPDGRAMFINIQHDNLTLVITGPFPEVPPPVESETDTESDAASGSTDASTGETPTESLTNASTVASTGAGADPGADDPGLDDDGCDCDARAGSNLAGAAGLALAAVALAPRRGRAGDREQPEDHRPLAPLDPAQQQPLDTRQP